MFDFLILVLYEPLVRILEIIFGVAKDEADSRRISGPVRIIGSVLFILVVFIIVFLILLLADIII